MNGDRGARAHSAPPRKLGKPRKETPALSGERKRGGKAELDRDFTACYNLTLATLRVVKADEKAVKALRDWLKQHPKTLI